MTKTQLKGFTIMWPPAALVLLLALVGLRHGCSNEPAVRQSVAMTEPEPTPARPSEPVADKPKPVEKAPEPAKAPAAPAPEKMPETKPETPAPVPASPAAPGEGVGGTVKLTGAAPAARKIDMSGVQQCAAQHADPVVEESIVVGAGGALANVVVSIRKEEGADLAGPPGTPAVLDQKGCQYLPHVVAVMAGQPVIVKNSDPFLHNVHTLPEKNEGENKAMPTVDVNGAKLKSPGTPEYYRVKCDVHPWMSAWVAVIDNPYFAVTDKDGKFKLPRGLPDGDYTLHAWHESLGEQDAKITVKDGAGSAAMTFQAK